MRTAIEHFLMSAGEVVMESDVAAVVRERLSKERRMVIDAVMTSGRALPEALAKQLLTRRDRTQTPTANSRVFLTAPQPRMRLSSPPPKGAAPDDDDAQPTWRPPKKDGDGHDDEHGDSGEYDGENRLPMDFHPEEGESTVRNKQQVFASSRPPRAKKNGSQD
jgi:hypothetical protein